MKQPKLTWRDVTVDLASGSVSVRTGSAALAQNVCLAMSVAVLHALCEPRPVRKVDLATVHHSADSQDMSIIENREIDGSKPKLRDPASLQMVLAAGYLHDIPCNSYLKNYLPHSGCSACCDGM